MGALTINRKRGFDHYSPNCFQPSIHSPLSHNIHISKKPKLSTFTNQSPVPSRKGKSRVFSYPEPVNPIKREVHAPCRVTKFGSFASRRVVEREIFNYGIGNVLGSRFDSAKRVAMENSQVWKEEAIDVDDVADEEIKVVEVTEDDVQGMVTELTQGVEVLHDEVHEMETELDEKEVEKNTEIEKSNENTSDLASLNKKLRLLGRPVYKQLWENAESMNPKLNSLSFQIELYVKRQEHFQLLRPVKQPEKEEVLREAFVPLTKEEKAEVSRAFSNSNSMKVLATHDNSNIMITGEVLQCLRPKEWLNDEVINVYLELLKERERREPKKFLKCHFFNTFFYKKLTYGHNGYDYKSVRRWTTQRKLGYALIDCEKIFVPIHKQYHWCLAIINKKDKKFQYLDSLGGTDSYVLEALARYYVEEVKDKSGQNIDVSSWKKEYIKDLPAQRNGFDCGVFMVKYTDFYSRGLGLCFKQEDMPYFRLRTAKEILKLRAD